MSDVHKEKPTISRDTKILKMLKDFDLQDINHQIALKSNLPNKHKSSATFVLSSMLMSSSK